MYILFFSTYMLGLPKHHVGRFYKNSKYFSSSGYHNAENVKRNPIQEKPQGQTTCASTWVFPFRS